MKKIIFLSLLIPTIAFSQFSISMGPGYCPIQNNEGCITGNLGIRCKLNRVMVEYNQNIAFSTLIKYPSLFQGRVGYSLIQDMGMDLGVFTGYSITTAPTVELSKVGHGGVAGGYLILFTQKDYNVKIETSVSNSFHVSPSISWCINLAKD